MSINITLKDYFEFVIELFNIKSTSSITAITIKEKLQKLNNPAGFISFAEESISEYEYFTGIQKFIKCFNDFNNTEKRSAIDLQLEKEKNYSKKLFDKIVTVFKIVEKEIEEGATLGDESIGKFINLNLCKDVNDAKIIVQIGTRREIFNQVKYEEYDLLLDKIERIVRNEAYKKIVPKLEVLKTKTNEALVLERLKKNQK